MQQGAATPGFLHGQANHATAPARVLWQSIYSAWCIPSLNNGGHHLALGRNELNLVVVKCRTQERKPLQNGLLRLMPGRRMLNQPRDFHREMCVGGQQFGVLLALPQPVLDLIGLEPCDGRQVGEGFLLGHGPLDTHHQPPRQRQHHRHRQQQRNERAGGTLRRRRHILNRARPRTMRHWSKGIAVRLSVVTPRGCASPFASPSLKTSTSATSSCACVLRLSAAEAISSTRAAFCWVT